MFDPNRMAESVTSRPLTEVETKDEINLCQQTNKKMNTEKQRKFNLSL